jgi:alkylation response protein AidB-like acyl-CoA dehydrogenase
MAAANDGRTELQEVARRMLDDVASPEKVRALLDDPMGFDPAVLRSLTDLGWPGIHIPEELGGAGGSWADLAVVLHEFGRHLSGAPLVASAALAGGVMLAADNLDLRRSLLPDLAAGERAATLALANRRGSYAAGTLDVHWEPATGGIRLRGVSGFVLDAHIADVVVVAASNDAGEVSLACVHTRASGVTVTPVPTVDQTRRLSTVTFRDVEVPEAACLGEPGTQRPLAEYAVDLGAVVVAADSVGVAERVMEVAAAYARDRVQFGRPIGTFQAVKHRCADMVLRVEASRAAVLDAIEHLDQAQAPPTAAASIAKSYAGDAAASVCQDGVQVHGGIGFTWEHDMHLYLKRAKLDQALFGSSSWHRRRLAHTVIVPATAGAGG